MATVGNLFVNIRGKTEKFEKDLKRSTRRVSKSFARDQERAMIQLREARERVGRLTTASPARFKAAIKDLRKAEHNLRMAEARQPRMEAWRRAYENRKQRKKDQETTRWSVDYESSKRKYLLAEERKQARYERMKVRDQAFLNRKQRLADEEKAERVRKWSAQWEIYKRQRLYREEFSNRRRDRLRQRDLLRQQAGRQLFGKRGMAAQLFQASPLAGFLTVLGAVGLTISTAKSIVNFAINSARRGSELTERFKFAGPMGGKLAQIEAAKIQQQLQFAQDPTVSAAKLRRGRAEYALEESQMTLSAAYDYAVAFLKQAADFYLRGGAVDPGGAAVRQAAAMQRATGLTGQGP
jgi:hypothetical protein